MKVPPPEKPPTYDKDRNFTRRNVAGAAGGLLGVDYEDPRLADPSSQVKPDAAEIEAGTPREKAKEPKQNRSRRALAAAPKEEAEMYLQDEDPITRDEKTKEKKRRLVARDRMTVDKDPPQLLRRPRWDSDEEPPVEPDEIDLELLSGAIGDGALDALADRRAFIGDPRLTDPLSIKEALGSPVAYAKHVMILAEAFRGTTGARREEAIAYLTLMFAALGDRAFARQSIKELGPATGIIDLYPLEVTEHLLEAHPGLLLKFGFGSLVARPKQAPVLQLEAGVATEIDYPPSLRIRGFAVKGGGRLGYRFEPGITEGRYALTIFTPGLHRLLISGVTRSGHTVIDRVDVEVADGPLALPALDEPELPRDEAKIAAWPRPEPIPFDYERVLDEEDPAKRADSGTMLTTSERICLQQRDALETAREESFEFIDGEHVETLEAVVAVEPPEEEADLEDTLSRAEASLLKLAVVLGTDASDLKLVPKSPEEEEITVTQRAYRADESESDPNPT